MRPEHLYRIRLCILAGALLIVGFLYIVNMLGGIEKPQETEIMKKYVIETKYCLGFGDILH